MSDQSTRYDLNAKELDALMLWSGPLGDMAKAAVGFLTGFDVLVPVTEPLLTREEAANDPEVIRMVLEGKFPDPRKAAWFGFREFPL